MIFVEMNEKEFISIQDSFSNSNYYQTVKWGKVKGFTGWKCHYIGIKKDEVYLCASLILSKKIIGSYKIFYAPRGVLIDYNNYQLLEFFTKKTLDYLKRNNGIFLKIDPCIPYTIRDKNGNKISVENKTVVHNLLNLGYLHNGFTTDYSKDVQYRWTYSLDILPSLKEMEKNMDKRCRRCLRKEERYPLIMKNVDDYNIYDFKMIMEHTSKRQNHFDRSLEYYLKLKKELKNDIYMKIIYLDREKYLLNFSNDKLYEIIKKEKRDLIPLSAGVFIKDKNSMHYVYGGTYQYYMSFMAQYKMQIDMIMIAKMLGIKIYDFGGISGNFNSNSPYYGIYEFKRGFGGFITEYIGEFDLVANKELYHLYNLMYKLYKDGKRVVGCIKRS